MLNQVSMVGWCGKMVMNPRDWDGHVLVDKSQENDRDVGKQMKKDTWLLNGIVPTLLFIPVRFFQNSLNYLECSLIIWVNLNISEWSGALPALCFKAPTIQ